jgi:hypothetical protein
MRYYQFAKIPDERLNMAMLEWLIWYRSSRTYVRRQCINLMRIALLFYPLLSVSQQQDLAFRLQEFRQIDEDADCEVPPSLWVIRHPDFATLWDWIAADHPELALVPLSSGRPRVRRQVLAQEASLRDFLWKLEERDREEHPEGGPPTWVAAPLKKFK